MPRHRRANNAIGLLELDRVDNEDLRRTLNQLAHRHQAVENEAAELAQANTDLVSHANPHQKISQVAKMRAELTEARREAARRAAELEEVVSQNSALKAQLDGLVSVTPHNLGRSMARSRVGRVDMDDLLDVIEKPAFTASAVGRLGDSRNVRWAAEPDRLGCSSVGGARRAGRVLRESQGDATAAVVGKPKPIAGAIRQTGLMTVAELL